MVQRAAHKLKQRYHATDGPVSRSQTETEVSRYGWSSEQFLNWNRGSATDGPVSSSQTETEVALQMVQWAAQKLEQRWRYGWSNEQFTNWIWGGAIGWSREQFLNWNRGSATDGPVSSSWTETEGPLRMVQWAVHKLKQRWRYRWSSEQFTNCNRGGAKDECPGGQNTN